MIDTTQSDEHFSLSEILDRCQGREVWVVGDLMLDQYVQGAVERISPEAPVPVVTVRDVEYRVGGAANVAQQITALGGCAVLGGVIGDDDTGKTLLENCARAGIDTRAVLTESSRTTTRKLRVVGHGQQLLRLDWEDAVPVPDPVSQRLFQRLLSGPKPEVIILCDYAKGVLTDGMLAMVIDRARAAGVRVLVDPKRQDFAAYRGASMLTPNLKELALAAGRNLNPDDTEAVAAAARPLVAAAQLDWMVVTLGHRGILLVPADGSPRHIPTVRRAVSDVTGAGDTVIAVLAIALAGGAEVGQAAEIANAAAGVAIGEVGAVAVQSAQLRDALSGRNGGKVLDRAELAARAKSWRAAGKRVVFTNGCFDLLHAGHLSLLHQAAHLGDLLVVAINSDESVRRLKGQERPILPAVERAALLAALTCVDAVTIYDEPTPLEVLLIVRPRVLVKGQDYKPEDVVGRELVESAGGRVVLVPLVASRSTSALIQRICQDA
ncbi:MAG: D-glycero-beta-D-manno-heptose 1-phosphate adenylyltransferase [Steroidobacteraceae bacterium]